MSLPRRAFGLLKTLWHFVRPFWKLALAAVIFSMVAALVEGLAMVVFALVAQLLTGKTVEQAAGDFGRLGEWATELLGHLPTQRLAVTLLLTLVGLQLLRSGLQLAGKFASIRMQTCIDGGTRKAIFNQFMRLSFSQLRGYRTGEMTSLIEHVMYLGMVFSRTSTIFSQLVLSAVYLGVLAWLSLKMTLWVFLAGLVITGSLLHLVRLIRRQGARFTRASVALSEDIVEFLHGLRVVLTYAREEFARKRVHQIVDRGVAAHRTGLHLQAVISPIMDSLTILGIAGILMLGIYQMDGIEGSGLARLLTFLFVLYRLMPRIRILNDNFGHVLGYLPFVERISAILDDQDKDFKRLGGSRPAIFERTIEFRDVTFQYPAADRPAVENFNLTLPSGSMVALVGPSGGGKSTVADLLIGLVHPTSGQILVDGVELPEVDWHRWREVLGVVSQDTFVFSASVAENVAFGALDATREQIEQASREAGVHGFTMEMPEGYETLVGNQGARLSGGQRQRLGIARALVRQPRLLILDEATSNLDSQAEHEIQEALRSVSRQRTTVAIAHRLSTVSHADHILVMEGGRIGEQGTHDELMALGGRYAELWKLQVQSG
ncbi:MAG: ABC transporter ATP-binding protein [Acidobacteriota bacterium]